MDASYLFAALLWGTVGFGFFIYGKKQQKLYPLIGGVLLIGMSYFVKTPLHLTIASLAVIGGIYFMWNKS